MTRYFIEVRLTGDTKVEAKNLIENVRKKFKLRGERPVPHITIVYNPNPKNTNSYEEKRLIQNFTDICSQQLIYMDCELNGFNKFSNHGVALIRVIPSKELGLLRKTFIKKLGPFCNLHPEFDDPSNFKPHVAIAKGLTPQQLIRIMKYLQTKREPQQKYLISRITLLKNTGRGIEDSKILCEYDFFLHRPLNRMEAKSGRIQTQTEQKIKEFVTHKTIPHVAKEKPAPKKAGFLARSFARIKNLFKS